MGGSPNAIATTLIGRLPAWYNDKDDGIYPSRPINNRQGFEWAHLIGYSLGGVNQPRDDNQNPTPEGLPLRGGTDVKQPGESGWRRNQPTRPQLQQNLVLGTWTVNSHMIQSEEFLKTLLLTESKRIKKLKLATPGLLSLHARVTPLLNKQHREMSEQLTGGKRGAPDSQQNYRPNPLTGVQTRAAIVLNAFDEIELNQPAAAAAHDNDDEDMEDVDSGSWPTWSHTNPLSQANSSFNFSSLDRLPACMSCVCVCVCCALVGQAGWSNFVSDRQQYGCWVRQFFGSGIQSLVSVLADCVGVLGWLVPR
jgi:hypothetical protein